MIQLLPKTKTERGKARTALFLIRTKLNILGPLKIRATFSWGHISTTWLQFKKYVPAMKDKDIVLPMIPYEFLEINGFVTTALQSEAIS